MQDQEPSIATAELIARLERLLAFQRHAHSATTSLREQHAEALQLANIRLDRIQELEAQLAALQDELHRTKWSGRMGDQDYPPLTTEDFGKN